mmetsp:Transcript_33856/g.71015  ORF Transcript_33856/g.71015 Transcript_33856/m.71015 type:complete len:263 (-) Transcript_33856:622-1410(-)
MTRSDSESDEEVDHLEEDLDADEADDDLLEPGRVLLAQVRPQDLHHLVGVVEAAVEGPDPVRQVQLPRYLGVELLEPRLLPVGLRCLAEGQVEVDKPPHREQLPHLLHHPLLVHLEGALVHENVRDVFEGHDEVVGDALDHRHLDGALHPVAERDLLEHLRLGPVLLPDGEHQLARRHQTRVLAVVEAHLLAVVFDDGAPVVGAHLERRQLREQGDDLRLGDVPEDHTAVLEVEDVPFLPIVFFGAGRGARQGDVNYFVEIK